MNRTRRFCRQAGGEGEAQPHRLSGSLAGQVFPNPRLRKALLDRITDRAHIIETGTDSYRFRRTLEVRKKKKAS